MNGGFGVRGGNTSFQSLYKMRKKGMSNGCRRFGCRGQEKRPRVGGGGLSKGAAF